MIVAAVICGPPPWVSGIRSLSTISARLMSTLWRFRLAKDRDPRLKLGRLHIGQQPPLEPAAQPVLQGDQALGRPVGGDDDLLARVVQCVEGVEKLLLGSFLVLQELDVVHEEHVDIAVPAAESALLARAGA